MRQLPIVHINGKQFFVEERFHSLREKDGQYEFFNFASKADLRDFLYAIGAPLEMLESMV